MLSWRGMKAKNKRPSGDRQYRSWVTTWIALTFAILVYFAVALWVKPVGTAENPKVERILIAISAAYVIASLPAKRWLLVQAEEIDSDAVRRAATVVPMVLCEMAAVTGFALRMVIGSSHYYVFLLLGLAGMLLNFPRRANLNRP
jgi:hypothetical protein